MYAQSILGARFRYREIVLFAGKNIYTDRTPSTEYERKANAQAWKLMTLSIFANVCVLISYSLIIVGPTYEFVFRGVYALPTGVIVPFVDPDTGRGFATNLGIQLGSAVVAYIGIIAIEILSCMIINTFTA